jgi:putative ATP-binding cassette transporter
LSAIRPAARTRRDVRAPAEGPAFDVGRWRRFVAIAGPYWRSEERWRAGVLIGLLAALLLGQTAFNLLFVGQSGELTSALAAHDAERFWSAIRVTLVLVIVAVPIWACYYYVRDSLGIRWRRWLTHRFVDDWLRDRAYYRLAADGGIDNPDQRIAEDVATFTQQSLYFGMVALGALIQLVAFVAMLWAISRPLVYFLVAYAVLGTVVTARVFGRPLIGLNFRQLRREADFRFGLVRIREHAEPIAFSRGEHDETDRARRRFDAVFTNFRHLIRTQFALNLFQYAFSFLTLVLPSSIIASRVLSGELEVGSAVQAGGAFAAILAAMTVIVDHFEGLSRLSAGVDRLYGFAQRLERPDEAPGSTAAPAAGTAFATATPATSSTASSTDSSTASATASATDSSAGPDTTSGGTDAATAAIDRPRIETVPAPRLVLAGVSVDTPDGGRRLLRGLSVAVEPGCGLLIVGGSGGGKSSLLRAIGGLWTAGEGRIERPPPEQVVFLPQHPYMPLGTLRDQLLYPDRSRALPDAELAALLERVNLGALPARMGGPHAEHDWGRVLSIGEQQRLAFARVLLAQPRYAMLDEATSALDAANEAHLYGQLAQACITPVSVSHRPALLRFHHQVLELPGDGGWRLQPARGYRFT